MSSAVTPIVAWFLPDRVLLARGVEGAAWADPTVADPTVATAATTLSIGPATLARVFAHDPPSGPELERAIDLTEDAIMAVHRASPHLHSDLAPELRPDLSIGGPALGAWADRLAPRTTRAALEDLFTLLAAASEGLGPRGRPPLPPGPDAAAVLLILRELTHHLGFEAVAPLRNPTPVAPLR